MLRIVALMLAIGAASPALVAQTADAGRAAMTARDSLTRALEAARVQAESARAAAARDVARAEAVEESTEAATARGQVPPQSGRARLVEAANVVTDVIVLTLLVLLWFALGRAPVRRWLAERHGAQVMLLWGAVILYTFISCAASVASIFSRPGEPVPTAPVLAAAWLALLIITWRWASARGAATRTR